MKITLKESHFCGQDVYLDGVKIGSILRTSDGMWHTEFDAACAVDAPAGTPGESLKRSAAYTIEALAEQVKIMSHIAIAVESLEEADCQPA